MSESSEIVNKWEHIQAEIDWRENVVGSEEFGNGEGNAKYSRSEILILEKLQKLKSQLFLYETQGIDLEQIKIAAETPGQKN